MSDMLALASALVFEQRIDLFVELVGKSLVELLQVLVLVLRAC
jgi:hypothetical protein